MKQYILMLALAGILIACSKIDGAADNTSHIVGTTTNIHEEAENIHEKAGNIHTEAESIHAYAEKINEGATKIYEEARALGQAQKELGAGQATEKAIADLKKAKSIEARLKHATNYFSMLPFQFIEASPERRKQYLYVSLAGFFSDHYSDLLENSNYLPIVVDIPVHYLAFSEDYYEPDSHMELSALAVRMFYINPDQKKFVKEPVSFMDLVFELVDAHFYLENCADCKLEDIKKDYLRETLEFSGEAIKFLQLSHNALIVGGILGFFRQPSLMELGYIGLYKDYAPGRYDLVKWDTNTRDIKTSIDRFKRAELIRTFLSKHGVEIKVANVIRRNLTPLMGLKIDETYLTKIKNQEKVMAIQEYMTFLEDFYNQYLGDQQQPPVHSNTWNEEY